jgi:hypothetical protein
MLVCAGQAQSWQPMPQNGAIYRHYYEHVAPPIFQKGRIQYMLSGDTLIGPWSYTKVFETNYGDAVTASKYVGAMREDSLRKVYYWPADSNFLDYFGFFSGCAGGECLLFDFGLNIGDTFHLHPGHYIQFVVVSDIDTIPVSGQHRTRYRFSQLNGSVIEGIGWTTWLFEPLMAPFETSIWMTCYASGNTFYSPLNLDSIGCLSVGIETPQPISGLKVYPNPVKEILYLESDTQTQWQDLLVNVYNTNGMLMKGIKTTQARQGISISVHDLAPGLYFGRLTSEGNTHAFRFAVER